MSEKRILIIEDDSTLGYLFATVAEQCGIASDIVTNGRQGLDYLSKYEPDVVLMDMHLPLVSGLEILEYIESESRLQVVKVIILSADGFLVDSLTDRVEQSILLDDLEAILCTTVQ